MVMLLQQSFCLVQLLAAEEVDEEGVLLDGFFDVASVGEGDALDGEERCGEAVVYGLDRFALAHLDDVLVKELVELGVMVHVPFLLHRVEEAVHLFDDGRIDAMLLNPSHRHGFQHVSDLQQIIDFIGE